MLAYVPRLPEGLFPDLVLPSLSVRMARKGNESGESYPPVPKWPMDTATQLTDLPCVGDSGSGGSVGEFGSRYIGWNDAGGGVSTVGDSDCGCGGSDSIVECVGGSCDGVSVGVSVGVGVGGFYGSDSGCGVVVDADKVGDSARVGDNSNFTVWCCCVGGSATVATPFFLFRRAVLTAAVFAKSG